MPSWNELHPMGTLFGDPLPGAPALASRGSVTVGVRTLTLVHPAQADVLSGMQDGHYPRYDRPLKPIVHVRMQSIQIISGVSTWETWRHMQSPGALIRTLSRTSPMVHAR